MRYVGIAPPPRSGSRAYNPRRLIEVEERGPEEEHRRDDEVSEEACDPSRRLAGPVQEQDEHEADEHEREQECRQRSRGMDVVGAGKLDGPAERLAETSALDDSHWDDQTDEREPGHRRQCVGEREERSG